MQKRSLSEVFKTVGLPPYTYVKPPYFGEVRADIEQAGKHLLIEGPSGVGKTCIVFKVFEDLGWIKDKEYFYVSGRDVDAEDRVKDFINKSKDGALLGPRVMVIDDFHILPESFRVEAGSDLKRISDLIFDQSFPPKVILIGIPTAGVSLLASAQDLGPRLGSYRFKRATDKEIQRVISEGESELNIIFEDSDVILSESAGNYWLAQFICNKICAISDLHSTQDEITIVQSDLLSIRQRLMEELSNRFLPTAKNFARGKKWRPGGNKPYLEILLSIAKLSDLVIPFDSVLSLVSERRRPGIRAVRGRINEVIFDPAKGIDLRKQLAFEDAGFSIEDPLFRYYLTYMDHDDLYRSLGIEGGHVERVSVYSYDIGFSFAGECRSIVEFVNTEFKKEDVVTFYDYDQQAFLLAEDLESTLGRIYQASCQYYLVFIESNYMRKVWTRFERDIMTNGSRSRHIIPVYLEIPSESSIVGIGRTTGMIDLSDVWRAINVSHSIDDGAKAAIRNRIVLPLIEKIGATFQEV